MRILIVHNHYTIPGGEDEVVDSESRLLKEKGHTVLVYTCNNRDLDSWSWFRKSRFVFKEAFWSEYFHQDLTRKIRQFKPNIIHVHNPFYLLSPSVYDACYREKVPVVQTLHNYRFLCPAGTLFRNGHPCHDCIHQGLKQAVLHSCWQHSMPKTFFLSQVLRSYRHLKMPQDFVSRFIVPSAFTKSIFVQAGWPENRIIVKPNIIFPYKGEQPPEEHFVLFAGALYDYKGIGTLLKVWGKGQGPCILKMVGDGPLKHKVISHLNDRLEYLGRLPANQVRELMARAMAVVVPSLCYETFSRVIAEAYSCGTPVIASNLGALRELVIDQQTGLLFTPDDAQDLEMKISSLLTNTKMTVAMRSASKVFFEKHLSMESNYKQLINIYQSSIDTRN